MDDNLRREIIGNQTVHSYASKLLIEFATLTKHVKPMAAAKLAFVFRISFGDALAVMSEMSVQDPYSEVY